MSQLDLNLLLVLKTVLVERSVLRAARQLHVTPSAISNSLARLRNALGDPLVVRSGRGIVPTPRAEALLPLLQSGLHDLERAVAAPAFDPASTTQQFTLAVADAGQIVQVPRLAAELAKRMPNAKLRVVGIDTFLSSGALAGGQVDVALAALPDAPGTVLVPLYQERTVLVARKKHPLIKVTMSKQRLTGLRHVDVEVSPGRGYRDLAAAYKQLGIEREVVMLVPSFAAAASLVAATDFVTTLPESLVERYGASFGVRAFAASAPRVSIMIKMAWHERTDSDPAMRAFREMVVSSTRARV